MFKEREKFNWPCFKEIQTNWIAGGFDSNVYKYTSGGKDYVVKAYKTGAVGTDYFKSDERISLYLHLMNRANKFVEETPLQVIFPFSKFKQWLKINPVISARICHDCRLIEAVSLFIPGKNLNMLPHEFDIKELAIALKDSGNKIETELGVRGINIIPDNAKKLDEESIIITDLCANTLGLRRAYFSTSSQGKPSFPKWP